MSKPIFKKIVLVLLVFVVVAMAGVGIFILTFDADRYRPQLVNSLQETLGRPVRLDHLSLGWRHGLALELRGLDLDQLVQVDLVRVNAQWLPLLKGNLQVASIYIVRPRLFIERKADGSLNVQELAGAAASKSAPTSPTPASQKAAGAAAFFVGQIQVEKGTIQYKDAASPTLASLTIQELDLILRNVSLTQPINFKGRMEMLMPARASSQPSLRGKLSASFEGQAQGRDANALLRDLSGQAQLSLTDGAITHLNVLREIFQRFSILPGLVETLLSRLPPEYQQKLAAEDTLLQSVDIRLKMAQGTLALEALHLATDTFELEGSDWRLGLDGTLTGSSLVRVDPQLSEALVRSVSELQLLANTKGQLEIPVRVQGTLPNISVLPDLNYVASHLVTQKTEEIIGSLLNNLFEKAKKPKQ